MEVLIIIATSLNCIACFLLGASIRQKVDKGEKIETPTINPVQAVREHKATKEAEKKAEMEQHKFETIQQNIEKYDGTAKGQEDVP